MIDWTMKEENEWTGAVLICWLCGEENGMSNKEGSDRKYIHGVDSMNLTYDRSPCLWYVLYVVMGE